MNLKIILVVTAVILTSVFIVNPVSATYNAENPYNSLWYGEGAWEDKMDEFLELTGANLRVAFTEVQDMEWRLMENDLHQIAYLLNLYEGVCDGSVDFSTLSAIEQYQMDCYYDSGTFWSSEEQSRIINESMNAYFQWFVSTMDCEIDEIPSDAVFLPLPDAITYNPNRSYIKSIEPEPPEIVYVDKPVEIVREIIREVPVEVIHEIIREVPVEVIKEVQVETPLESDLPERVKGAFEWDNNPAIKVEENHIKTAIQEFCENVINLIFS